MVRIALVDDSVHTLERLQFFLRRYEQEHDVIFHIDLFKDGVELTKRYAPIYDIIFLDIEMPNKDGMSVAREIREKDSNVILVFVTQMAQYAIDGYEVQAMDFLVKPLDYTAMELRMDKLLNIIENRRDQEILIASREGTRKIPSSRLIYVEVIKHRIIYHTETGDYEIYGSMRQVEEELGGTFFARCDNCFLVNLRHVTWVGQNELTVGGYTLKISRPRRKTFMKALTDYIGGVT